VLILEGWGLTETTAATCVNRPERFRFGTVGLPVPGVELRIAPDGEILVRGAPVMREYHRKPEATAEALDAEGWFHTGDVGVLEDGFLRITDRKKDLIVTSLGKNVAPQAIENALKAETPLISQVMVYGDRRPYLVALITLAEDTVTPWARERGITFSGVADLARHEQVRAAIQRAVDAVNGRHAPFESVRRFHVVESDFTQQNGQLTPTMKVKRKAAAEAYAAQIASLYEGHSAS
jgi:long-chain acyl-CoA synthetase